MWLSKKVAFLFLTMLRVGVSLSYITPHEVDEVARNLTKWLDILPIPTPITPNTAGSIPTYQLYEVAASVQFHSELPPSPMWLFSTTANGNGASYPGPFITVEKDQPINVTWHNLLPVGPHLLPYDPTVDHNLDHNVPQTRTVTHVHGGHNVGVNDGYPDYWIQPGESATYHYTNDQASYFSWYHDHAICSTRLNVYAGLAGIYRITDTGDDALNLPSGQFDVPLLIADKSFYSNGSLYYGSAVSSSTPFPSPSIVTVFVGNVPTVNGKIWPRMQVQARKYYFHIVSAGNCRFWNFFLCDYDEFLAGRASDTLPRPLEFTQVQSDGGLMPHPVKGSRLLLGPAERAGIVVDFSQFSVGTRILLANAGPDEAFGPDDTDVPSIAHLAPGDPFNISFFGPPPYADFNTTGQVLLFEVIALTGTDSSTVPSTLVPIQNLVPTPGLAPRPVKLDYSIDQFQRPVLNLNDESWFDGFDVAYQDETEIWEFYNHTPDAHPLHIHQVFFQIIDRQFYNVSLYFDHNIYSPLGPLVLPDDNELGWKDVVRCPVNMRTRIKIRFDLLGDSVYHCHMLEHEDYDMMRKVNVFQRSSSSTGSNGSGDDSASACVTYSHLQLVLVFSLILFK